VKYLILIRGNEATLQYWKGLTHEQRVEATRAYAVLNEKIESSGEVLAHESLDDPSTTKRVPARAGQSMSTDGPFAEVKEHLAGFYLVDCVDQDRALEIAGQIPEAAYGLVEVTPVRDLSHLGL
jgi:hypothetical protein